MGPTEEDMGGLEPWAVGRGNIAGHSVMEADHQTHTVSYDSLKKTVSLSCVQDLPCGDGCC